MCRIVHICLRFQIVRCCCLGSSPFRLCIFSTMSQPHEKIILNCALLLLETSVAVSRYTAMGHRHHLSSVARWVSPGPTPCWRAQLMGNFHGHNTDCFVAFWWVVLLQVAAEKWIAALRPYPTHPGVNSVT